MLRTSFFVGIAVIAIVVGISQLTDTEPQRLPELLLRNGDRILALLITLFAVVGGWVTLLATVRSLRSLRTNPKPVISERQRHAWDSAPDKRAFR